MADFSMLSFSKKTCSFLQVLQRGTVGFLATGLSAADVLPLGRDAIVQVCLPMGCDLLHVWVSLKNLRGLRNWQKSSLDDEDGTYLQTAQLKKQSCSDCLILKQQSKDEQQNAKRLIASFCTWMGWLIGYRILCWETWMFQRFPVSRLLEMRSDALALYPKITKLHKQVWLAGGETHRILVDLNRFYSSTWFFEAFQEFPTESPKSFTWKKTQCGLKKIQEASMGFSIVVPRFQVTDLPQMQRYLKSPARYPFPKGNVGWDPGNSGVSTEVSMK